MKLNSGPFADKTIEFKLNNDGTLSAISIDSKSKGADVLRAVEKQTKAVATALIE